jgi:hypothetical protein
MKDLLWSYFLLIFLGGDPEVVVDAIDVAAGGEVIECKFRGGILIGDSSLYFLGSGRRYDFRMGL